MRLTAIPGVLLVALISAGCPTRNGTPPVAPDGPRPQAYMEIFFMSQCPYSAKLMKILPEIMAELDEVVELRLHAVVRRDEGGEFGAMHGSQELFGNLLEICAAAHAPDDLAKANFMACMSAHLATVPFGWEECAGDASIPTDPVKTCALSDEGQDLLAESHALVIEKGVQGSPYVFVDGVPHNVPISSDSLTSAICCAIEPGSRPAACPENPTCFNMVVDVTVVTDERCEDCATLVRETIKMFLMPFPLLEVHQVDYGDEGTPQLMEESKVDLLPAYLFHDNVKESAAYEMIEENVYESGGYVVVFPESVDSVFDPRREICTNSKDDTGNGLVDCVDPDCSENVVCREEIENRLDLFVMSMCPFGNEAVMAARDVYKHLKGELDIELHWIETVVEASRFKKGGLPEVCIEHGDSAYCSLHGKEETEENLRQICAQSLYPTDKFLSYISCRANPAIAMEWTECASASDLDVERIETCAEGDEGHALLAEDAKLTDILGIGASPMYMWNNTFLESVPFTPAAIASKACELNPEMKHCDTIHLLEDEGMPVPPEAKCYE